MPNRRWTRDEDILVLDLYVRGGRQRLRANHPEVKSLARIIGVAASTINARMANIVACDPDNPSKGRSNVAKQTRAVWDEFAHDEPLLRRAANEIRRKYGLDDV